MEQVIDWPEDEGAMRLMTGKAIVGTVDSRDRTLGIK
jgi:hypothetical protein